MRRIYIVNTFYLNEELTGPEIGGIQSYITSLSDIILEMGFEPAIYQFQLHREPFVTEYRGIKVTGVSCSRAGLRKKIQKTVPENEIVIFASEEVVCAYKGYSICLQHGIDWDRPNHLERTGLRNQLVVFQRAVMAFIKIRQMSHADTIVCVDYNFMNWYRAHVSHPEMNLTAIPNYTKLMPFRDMKKEEGIIKIIFARRFEIFRGSRVFTDAVEKLLQEFSNIDVTIAGRGSDRQYITQRLQHYENVHITNYRYDQTLEMHKDKHIAVIPTVGSEGTSLSLLEAMASGCAVIGTDVGGIVNVVLDRFNGLIVMAGDTEGLYRAMKQLIQDRECREQLAENARKTVEASFSYEIWKEKWKDVLGECLTK